MLRSLHGKPGIAFAIKTTSTAFYGFLPYRFSPAKPLRNRSRLLVSCPHGSRANRGVALYR